MRHGGKVKQCSIEGCRNIVVKGGVCWRHGANRNTQDESTAFGSELELTNATTTQIISHHRASRAAVRRQEESTVPGEVTILCEEIVEV
jgi:hypothetical protein